MSTVVPAPFHLLEITIISAQGLYPATRSISTYASAWVDPKHKLYTGRVNHVHPTWNDKFVFRVDDAFLHSDTAAVNVHLHGARNLLRDHLLGTVRVVLSSLRPAPGARRFVALQVRRPTTLRPCGILNLGVALLDPYVKSMHDGLDSTAAFSYKDLIDTPREESKHRHTASDDCDRWQLQRNGSVDMERDGVGEREREQLETKLEIWKSEMSPENEWHNRRQLSKARSTGRLSFFSCINEMDCE
ncbi:hypothetical protein Cni_G13897 [Canna indica]|uniref:C2 domain-containing protein n=1 Tax=Canna indica TaxID=4628 RepID=A0AAQ3KGQ8_9LILI|nr:hypothetical protein Cni_G13897 [Canna indica]